MEWFHQQEEEDKLPPVELAALLHYKFVCIHPFDDGNGRISRLLMNYVLLRHGLTPIIIKSADKKNYLYALHQADAGDLDAFIHYIAEQQKWSLEISIKAAKGESIDEPGDLEKRLTRLKKEWGEDTVVRVVKKKDHATVLEVINKSVFPFATAWQNKLEEFDTFLFSRRIGITTYYGERSNANSNLGGEHFVELLRHSIEQSPANIVPARITLFCNPLGIRPLYKELGLAGGEIKFIFSPNFYEVKITNAPTVIHKIYDYMLIEEEIAKLVEEVGMILLNDLELNLEKHK